MFNNQCHFILNPTTFPVKESRGFSCKQANDMGWYLSRTLKQSIVSCTPNLQVLYIILPPKVIISHTNGDKARQGYSYSNVLCHNQKDGNQSTHIEYEHINIKVKKQTPQSTPKRGRNHLKSTPKIYVAI